MHFLDDIKLLKSSTVDMQSEGVVHTLSLTNCKLDDPAEIKFVSKQAESVAYLNVIGKTRDYQ